MARVFYDIELLRLSGDIHLAEKKLIKALRSFYSLTESGQSFVIRMLGKFGYIGKALSYLDKELNSEEIKNVSNTAIINQCVLARMKFYYGSASVAHRMCKTIAQEVISRNDISDQEKRVIWESLMTSFLLCQDFRSVCELSPYYPEIKNENKEEDFHFQLSLLASRCYLEKLMTFEILHALQKLRIRYPNPFHQWLVDIYEIGMVCDFGMLDEIGKTETYITKLQSMLDGVSFFKTHANAFLGMIYLHRKQASEAFCYFQKSLSAAVSFQERMRAIYFLEKIQRNQTSFADQVYLRCFCAFSEYAYLKGSRYRFVPEVDLPILKRDLQHMTPVDSLRDCWIIKNGEISLAHYDELPAQENVLDLFSGIFWKAGEAKYHLPEARSSILLYMIGASQYGVTDSYLIEKIYSDEFRNSIKGFERIRNQVIQLKRLGIKIKQKSRTYSYDFEQNPYTIIFPVTHQSHGVVAYCRKMLNLISAKHLADLLNISESTASLHIRDWKDQKLIKRSPDDPYGVWTFV